MLYHQQRNISDNERIDFFQYSLVLIPKRKCLVGDIRRIWMSCSCGEEFICFLGHFSDVIMSAIASQITSVSIVCPTVCLGADRRQHRSSAPLAFVREIHQCTPFTKGQLRGKCFHVIMSSSCGGIIIPCANRISWCYGSFVASERQSYGKRILRMHFQCMLQAEMVSISGFLQND